MTEPAIISLQNITYTLDVQLNHIMPYTTLKDNHYNYCSMKSSVS